MNQSTDKITNNANGESNLDLKRFFSTKNTRFYKRQILQRLENIQSAELIINDPEGKTHLGNANAENTILARIEFKDMQCYQDIALGGSNAAAETYIQGRWQTDNLTNVIRVMARNAELIDQIDNGIAAMTVWFLRKWHEKNKNSLTGSRKNIAAHYDLGLSLIHI